MTRWLLLVLQSFGFKSYAKNKRAPFTPWNIRNNKGSKKAKNTRFSFNRCFTNYRAKGVNALIMQFMMNVLSSENVEHLETNLNLEDNNMIQNQWKNFPNVNHKRRRCFIKNIK
jgi:hypothetical protein